MSKPQTHEQTEAQKLVDRIEKKQTPQDETQTHQESESQILVERIEKKASAQRKKQSARTPGQASTPKANGQDVCFHRQFTASGGTGGASAIGSPPHAHFQVSFVCEELFRLLGQSRGRFKISHSSSCNRSFL